MNKGDLNRELEFTNAPNALTLLRMALVPVVVIFMIQKSPGWDVAATVAFVVASVTDFFDGYIARMQKAETIFGKLMDPLADKFLVVAALIMLQDVGRIHPAVVILLICREIAITGLRALASAEGVVIAASAAAKWKTASQMVAIPMLMASHGMIDLPLYELGSALIYLSLAISLWSAKDYAVEFFRGLRARRAAAHGTSATDKRALADRAQTKR